MVVFLLELEEQEQEQEQVQELQVEHLKQVQEL